MYTEIAEAPKPVAPVPTSGGSDGSPLETVPENVKAPGPAKPAAASGQANAATTTTTTTAKDFPTKTDKPRPHVCLTCKRSFARLEHLKRHERSHTKEKPFECPECTRCFARRDLLLRHQQKLHMTTTPSSRPRAGRRESSSSTISAASKIRKNSAVHHNSSMRPRANTISNIGNPALEMFSGSGMSQGGIHSPQPTMIFGRVLTDVPNHLRPQMVPGHHGVPTGLPKINTSIANGDFSSGLRTAPIFTDPNFNMDALFSPDTTVNPAALHFPEGPHTAGLESPSPFQDISGMPMAPMHMEMGMDWMNDFGAELSMINTNDSQAIAGSSPSVIDTDSPEDAGEYALDGKPGLIQHSAQWQSALFPKGAAATLPEYLMDMGLNDPFPPGPPSPGMLPDFVEGHLPNPQFQLQNPLNPLTPVSGMMHPHQHHHHHHHQHHQQFPPLHGAESPSTMASTDASVRQGSVGSGFSIAVPETTRNAMMITLAQPSLFGQRKYSQPAISSPLSPGFAAKAQQAVNMPSTAEFQRFIVAYIKFFHPHMPFLHIPTLSFDIPFSSGNHGGRSNSPVFGVANSGGCLILAMSAIGALYEGETDLSKTLFNFSKRMLSIFFGEFTKVDNNVSCPPVWLVQAMLLNVIYGHMCGDKTSEINAHTHGAALISLAKEANLTVPHKKASPSEMQSESWNPRGEDPAWYEWHISEEKKRTLFAVFHVSCMLTTAYNHSPALRNGEVTLDLPCDEDLWAAESTEAWHSLGGSMATEQTRVPFNFALSSLLTAHSRQHIPMNQMSQTFCKPNGQQPPTPDWPRPEFHASTFGCSALINALHIFIWETRQRHRGHQWTAAEMEDMHRRIEPALIAWQSVWSAVPHHSVERPNPFGMGPLSADGIPLLDLAYLVLHVDMGKSKEYFWNRDFEGMSQEIASGCEIMQHAQQQEREHKQQQNSPGGSHRNNGQDLTSQAGKPSKRELHLRKAAAHAANSMALSARANTTFADFNSRELPIQSALCVFTCAQVLAEWVATLQERVGPYLGVLGVDQIDLGSVPAVMLLEQEDISLVEQIVEILGSTEAKMSGMPVSSENDSFMGPGQAGYAARLLHVTGKMLDRASMWPGKHDPELTERRRPEEVELTSNTVMRLMDQGLAVQARFMKDRAERSRVRDENV